MNYVVGIDQSARHTGVCILAKNGDVACLKLIEPKKLKDQLRLAFIRKELNALLTHYALRAAVMEGYSYNSTNKKFVLGEVGSVTKLAIYDAGAELYIAAPKQLKKFVTGRGSASKESVIKHIQTVWGVEIIDDNLADAYGLAQIAREIIWSTSTRRCQLDIVKNIIKKDLKKRKSSSIKLVNNAI
jgi:crossover junction endodeoxyribonuclease RuvC